MFWSDQFTAFCDKYAAEEDCERALFEARWPHGFRCPRCGESQAYVTRSRRLPLYECKSCRHQTTVIAGTVLEGSRTSLRLWLHAIYLHAESYAMPATQLSQILGVTYKTAWLMGHKLRHAMGTADTRQPLAGSVRINIGLYIRARIPGFRQKCEDESVWVGASMSELGTPRYIKIKRVSPEHLRFRHVLPTGVPAFISENVSPETSDLVCVSKLGSVDRIGTLVAVKIEACRWLRFGFHGGIGPKHLQAYLNQFCFNWNTGLRELSAINELLYLCANLRTIIYPVLVGRRLATAPSFRRSRLRPVALGQAG